MRRMILLALLLVAAGAGAAPQIEDYLIEPLDPPLFSQRDVAKIRKGHVVTTPVMQTAERQLVAAVACLLSDDHDVVLQEFLDVIPVTVGSDVLAHGPIDPRDVEPHLARVSLGPREVDELRRMLDFDGGYGLNFSAAEIEAFEAIDAQLAESGRLAEAQAVLRDLLAERTRSYAAAGLDGMTDYDRGEGGRAHISEEMRRDTEAMTQLAEPLELFGHAWLGDPPGPPIEVSDAYYWMTLDIEDRPVIALSHRLYFKNGGVEAVGIRDFYFSTFFDSGQTLALLVPVEEGILLAMASDFWVDFWSSAPSLKHAIGTKLLAKQMRHLVEERGICGDR